MAISTPTANGTGRIVVPFPLKASTETSPNAVTNTNNKIPPTTDRIDRTSFSSIKESHSGGVAQTFTDSKTSSYLRNQFPSGQEQFLDEDAILDDASSSSGTKTPEARPGMLTNPHSMLHGFVCPCDSFRGWKGISLKGRIASKSSSDLKGLGMRYDWETRGGEKMDVDIKDKRIVKVKGVYPAGQSPLERLPMELLGAIIDQLSTDIPPNGFTPRNIDLMSLLLTSRGLHTATLATLYSQITIPHSRIFRKFLSHISDHPALGTIVRRLDFSHFNPTGAGQTARERAQTQNLIPATLLQCLSLTPNLREFLAQEHIDDDLSSDVIKYLLCSLPQLKALDFCACSSTNFRDALNTVINTAPLPTYLPITRLSFHECPILPSTTFSSLLPRLKHLTHLDVAHTRITASALHSIPQTAKLTHLNLSKCSHLPGADVVDFLTNHPAAKSLVYLNLAMDVKSHEMLTPEDLTALLPILPKSLRSLNLKGSKMDKSHIPLLLPLTKHVEELGLGRHLDLSSITRLFVPSTSTSKASDDMDVDEEAWIPHTLRYLDVSDLSVAELDLGTLFGSSCPVLQGKSEPLEVVEVGSEVWKKVEKAPAVKRVGWCGKEAGRRGWLVRVRGVKEGEKVDSGARDWKWGACYWGMRKVPVARAEVGGMYGHYMFKR
ncbi:hypothetical protein N431DRAFT_351603 [Stipitochalara longipes BDJ]|nr:hypothetical protein N431DRAFT_351603 [Stipitochalara longipes BDJ]